MSNIVGAVTGLGGGILGGPGRTGLQIQIDPGQLFVTGIMLYAKKIDRLGMSFSSFKDPLKESLNRVIVPSIIKNFAAQGRPKWKELRKSTKQTRLRKGFPSAPILQMTGKLRREAVKKNIWEIRPLPGSQGADVLRLRAVYFGQKVPYAEFHQRGAGTRFVPVVTIIRMIHQSGTTQSGTSQTAGDERDIGKMPARPFIQLVPHEEAEIYNIFVSFMVKNVNKYWGSGSAGK
jgi:phage gpG-like protein